jgi:peptide/nickel transport system permease protein
MLKNTLREIMRYPTAVGGLAILLLLIITAILAMIFIPYDEAISLWRGDEVAVYQNPKSVPPSWFNLFTSEKLPATLVMSSVDNPDVERVVEKNSDGTTDITLIYTFDFQYDDFFPEGVIYFKTTYDEKQPFVAIRWITPEGEELRVADMGVDRSQSYRFSQDEKLTRRLGGEVGEVGLFMVPDSDPPVPQKGTYVLRIEGLTFEPDSTIEAELIMYGQVHGMAGTDHLRRDLLTPLLWGIPVALSFGLIASLGISVLGMAIAAIGVWYGGWIDETIQRITEVNLVLPFLPILIMIGTFYNRSIWLMLGMTIVLSIFGGQIKTNRAIFLQIKESTYVEAAKAYGASDFRIIFLYLIPRIIPVLIPALVAGIPGFVFLEAALAVLGLGDPVLPTWGKVINDAQNNGALFRGLYYWVLEPAALLALTGLAFAMLGFSLDRVFNPRLREA